jgi:hypothetical protein
MRSVHERYTLRGLVGFAAMREHKKGTVSRRRSQQNAEHGIGSNSICASGVAIDQRPQKAMLQEHAKTETQENKLFASVPTSAAWMAVLSTSRRSLICVWLNHSFLALRGRVKRVRE